MCLLLKLRFLAVSMAWSCARRAMVEGAPGLLSWVARVRLADIIFDSPAKQG